VPSKRSKVIVCLTTYMYFIHQITADTHVKLNPLCRKLLQGTDWGPAFTVDHVVSYTHGMLLGDS